MKAIIAHCKNYRSEVKGLSNIPIGIEPEAEDNKVTESNDAIVAFVTVEIGDDIERCAKLLADEVRKMSKDTGHSNVVLAPFGHLSSSLADSQTTKDFFTLLQDTLKDLNPKRVHFGSDKSLALNIFGHRGSVRFREFK